MKNNRKLVPVLFFLFCLYGGEAAIFAQSQNVQAVNWFKTGIQETNSDKKIAAYLKALELDPDFVEVLYNLGLTYKKKQDYRLAEQYLGRVLNAKSGPAPGEVRLRATYELAAVYRRNGKNRQAEEAFRQARTLATEASMRSSIALELGRFLFEEGNYPAALTELGEGVKIGGANTAQFETLITQTEVEIELQRLYEAAGNAQTSGNLSQAQSLFEQIKQTRPNYKDVETRLASLGLTLEAEKKQDALAVFYEQAQKHVREGNLEIALATYESVFQQDANYKDAAAKLETVRKQLAQKQRDQLLEAKYAEGSSALKQRDWTRALVAFEKVVQEDGSYRDARKRLNEAQRELDRESSENIAARYYADGIAAMNRKDPAGALAAFEKVRRLNANYRNVQTLLAQADQALAQQNAAAKTISSVLPQAHLDSLYQETGNAIAAQDWMAAAVGLEKLQLLHPNYRDVAQRLTEVRAKLNLAGRVAGEVTEEKQKHSWWSWVGGAALLFALPLLGLALFSSHVRARYQMFRGNYLEAMQIYERQLLRHPERTKLYPPLAGLYLLLGRKDEKALKVFKTVLQLNLPIANRDEINGIVAQQFLTEGRTDSDAIEVLEDALKSERQKQLLAGDRQV